MKTSFRKYSRKNGQDLCEISLENNQGMKVKILNYGATLEKVLLDGEDMILSLNSPEDYSKERNFLGGTVGRICGTRSARSMETWQPNISTSSK